MRTKRRMLKCYVLIQSLSFWEYVFDEQEGTPGNFYSGTSAELDLSPLTKQSKCGDPPAAMSSSQYVGQIQITYHR